MSTVEYIKNFVKDKNIASITPTSRSGVKKVCEKMDLNKKAVIVEYGPATGVFTEYLLERITDDSVIIAIELNENFVKYLNANFNDPRLKVHHGSAVDVDGYIKEHGFSKVDYVISGIPFSLMPNEVRKNIVQKTNEVLKEGGKFLPYQTFFQKDRHLKDHLAEEFQTVNDEYQFRNIPPMRVYEAIK
ncbi:class I SAM-dependent methyltransferase [Evansella tamaricis]|uniref:Methyltransferase domain-containing protein n=1 Tax=Evansella tamaricis TaxID=2069301 RepID=A0ABS6JLE9_9BACI|nr:methyltransferase domain-containing protein [Evansella tamaricis]MBU9714378.1 methyltransferase domain-containing protein [Evansella tamaricis]